MFVRVLTESERVQILTSCCPNSPETKKIDTRILKSAIMEKIKGGKTTLAMMSHQNPPERKLFYMGINLDKRIRKNHPDIPTPKIVDYVVGGERDPSYLIVEDLLEGKAWKGKKVKILKKGEKLTPAQYQAAKELHNKLGEKGLAWFDGHKNNLFFFEEGGKTKAGVLDHDMIVEVNKNNLKNTFYHNQASKYAMKDGFNPIREEYYNPEPDARSLMDGIFRATDGKPPK